MKENFLSKMMPVKFNNFLKDKKDFVIFSRDDTKLNKLKTPASKKLPHYFVVNVPEIYLNKESINFILGFCNDDDNLIVYDLADLGSSFEGIYKAIFRLKTSGINSLYVFKYELLFDFNDVDAIENFLFFLKLIKRSEKDIFSYRSKTGINQAKLKGVKIGRPKSHKPPKSPLDKYKRKIIRMAKAGYSVKHIAKILGVTYRQLTYYIRSRNIRIRNLS